MDYEESKFLNPYREVSAPEDGLEDFVITRRSVIECQLYVRASSRAEAMELARREQLMGDDERSGVFESTASEATLIKDTYRHAGSLADIGYTYK
jgi:hypothetical protein